MGMKQRVEKEVRRVISIKSSRRLSALSVFSLAIYEKGEMKGTQQCCSGEQIPSIAELVVCKSWGRETEFEIKLKAFSLQREAR